MKRFMLDTNTVSFLIKGHPVVARHVVAVPLSSLCISAITEGELRYGLAKRPDATRLHQLVREFLRRVNVLPWDTGVAARYGVVRAALAAQGKTLAPLDLLIAAHALAVEAILVTNDGAFGQIPGLLSEDWTIAFPS